MAGPGYWNVGSRPLEFWDLDIGILGAGLWNFGMRMLTCVAFEVLQHVDLLGELAVALLALVLFDALVKLHVMPEGVLGLHACGETEQNSGHARTFWHVPARQKDGGAPLPNVGTVTETMRVP